MTDGPVVDANPFPGPQAYGWDERAYFFGRANEIEELTSLVLSSSATLLYAPSGTGKSSLMQAGLAPHLIQRFDFHVLPMVHLGTGARADQAEDEPNQFVRAVTEAICHPDTEDVPTDIAAAAATSRPAGDPRLLLVLDQFEEVFSDPALWRQREEFFTALSDALRENTWLRAIIALRGDYLAELVPYEDVLPDHLAVRYQLEPLTEDAAGTAIQSAFDASGVALAEQVRATVLDLLLESQNSPHRARHVNTIQLQILCRRLWENLQGADSRHALAHALPTDLTDSMVRFVDDAIARAMAQVDADEATVRWWLNDTLITATGRRAFVQVEEERTAGLPNPVLDELVRVKLVQIEHRPGSKLAELTHDSMAEGVRKSFETWEQARRRTRGLVAGALFVLLVLIVGSFPFVLVTDKEPGPLAMMSGKLDREEIRLPFTGGAQAVVVDLVIRPGLDTQVAMLVVERTQRGTRTVGRVAVGAKLFITGSSLAVPTRPDGTYEVVLTTMSPDPDLVFDLLVHDLPLLARDVERAEGVSSARFGVLLGLDGPETLLVEETSILDVSAARVLGEGPAVVVVEGSRDQPIAVLDLGKTTDDQYAYASEPTRIFPVSATVTRLPHPSLLPIRQDKSVRVSIERHRLVTLEVENTGSLMALEGTCDQPVTATPALPHASSGPDLTFEFTSETSVGPLSHQPGSYNYLLTVGGSQTGANCELRLRRFDAPPLRTFGVHDVAIAKTDSATPLPLRLPGPAILTAQEQRLPDFHMQCDPELADLTTSGSGRMFAFVPASNGCTLWLVRPFEETGAMPVRLAIVPAPAGEG